jgi:hypothetical protein
MFSRYQLSSDCKNYPPEGAAFNEITQSLSRFGQGRLLMSIETTSRSRIS